MKSLNCCYECSTFSIIGLAKFYTFSQSVKKLCKDFFFLSLLCTSQNYKIVTTEERFIRNSLWFTMSCLALQERKLLSGRDFLTFHSIIFILFL